MAIRWGTIGCGSVCELKSAPALAKADGSELVAVMSRTAERAEDYARRHNVPRWTASADEIIHADDIDAVYIATPPDTHLEYALQVCAAGKPCYVEKPIARCAEEGETMTAAFEAAGLPLFVAYYRRGLPRFKQAKQLIDDGRLGQLTGVNYYLERFAFSGESLPWRLQAEHSGGGFFMDLGSHTLDIFDYLLGPLEQIQATAANLATPANVEDQVAMHFVTAGGAIGSARWNFAGCRREDRIEITGTAGRISMSCFGDDPVVFHDRDGQVEVFERPNPKHIQQPLIQSIVDQLHGCGACPSTGESATRTARVMDAALESYYGRRTARFWETPDTWPGLPEKRREICEK